MTDVEKIAAIKAILREVGSSLDALLTVYLNMAEKEIIGWRYGYVAEAERPGAVPSEYESVQILAVIVGFSQAGGEGQTDSSENGIRRTWKYESMVSYIRANVVPLAGVK